MSIEEVIQMKFKNEICKLDSHVSIATPLATHEIYHKTLSLWPVVCQRLVND